MSKIAYVLSGGGAKGSFQVGAMRYLEEKGIRPEAVYGTSVGALNATGYAFRGMDSVEAFWRGIKGKGDILSSNWWRPCAAGIYSTKPLRKILEHEILGPDLNPTCDAIVCYVDLIDLAVKYSNSSIDSKADFIDAALASASIPFVMEPVRGTWVDGGVREQTPLLKAIEDGYTEIYLILCNPVEEVDARKWSPSWPKIVSVGIRATDGLEHEVFMKDLDALLLNTQITVHTIANPSFLIDTLEFSPDKIKVMVDRGYTTAKAIVG